MGTCIHMSCLYSIWVCARLCVYVCVLFMFMSMSLGVCASVCGRMACMCPYDFLYLYVRLCVFTRLEDVNRIASILFSFESSSLGAVVMWPACNNRPYDACLKSTNTLPDVSISVAALHINASFSRWSCYLSRQQTKAFPHRQWMTRMTA